MNRRDFMEAVPWAAVIAAATPAGWSRSGAAAPNRSSASLREFHDRVLDRLLRDHPDAAQALGAADTVASGFSDYSLAGETQRLARMSAIFDELVAYDGTAQTQAERINSRVLAFFLQQGDPRFLPGLKSRDLPDLSYPEIQNIPRTILLAVHPFRHEQDVAAYISRLHATPKVLAQAQDRVRAQHAQGVMPPAFSIDLMIADLGAFIAPPASQNLLAAAATGKIPGLALPAGRATAFQQQIADAIDRFVYPAYRSFIDLLRKLRKDAGDRAGLGRYPRGMDYYKYLLATHTTTDMAPAEIHELGQDGIREIHAEMNRLFRELGFDDATLAQGFDAISQDPRFRYENSTAGRNRILEDLRQYDADIRRRAAEVFAWLPDRIVIEPIPAELERTSSTSFTAGSADGSRPGIFRAHMTDMLDVPNFELPIITYHEAIPGHGLQVSRARALQDMPSFRRALDFNAYVEGWAKYAEELPFEMGYNTDRYAMLGRWRLILYSTVNLALDTGVHALGWDRETGVEFFRKNAFVSRGYAERLFDQRIVAMPAQTCSYKIGYLKILELRGRMQRALGDSFSYKHFHSIVLDQGSVPLRVLETIVDETIDAQRRAQAPP